MYTFFLFNGNDLQKTRNKKHAVVHYNIEISIYAVLRSLNLLQLSVTSHYHNLVWNCAYIFYFFQQRQPKRIIIQQSPQAYNNNNLEVGRLEKSVY